MNYRTIVADPPWRYPRGLPEFGQSARVRTVPYPTLSVEEIADIPVRRWIDKQAHLYLWTTNHHLEHAWSIARAWGFEPKTLLVWAKSPRARVGRPIYAVATEFVLFGYRGQLDAKESHDRNWWEWKRGPHSAKPEAFLDMVETTSHPPRLEMFARRARFGWDYWGDESLETVELVSVL